MNWLRIFSPGDVEFRRESLPIARLPRELVGLRILHVSDTHFTKRWYRAHDLLLEKINAAAADLICFTGDLVDNRWNPATGLTNARRFIDGMRSRFGTFAIVGNHDGDLLTPYLAKWNCYLLHPGRAEIRVGAAIIQIIGLPCVARLDLKDRVLNRFIAKPSNATRIVLSHYPDHIHTLAALKPDIVLAGHTHGGQVCLPGGRPIITHDSLPKSMSVGIHRIENTWLVISRGVGFATYPIRVFAPPQVMEICLTAEEENVDQNDKSVERRHNADLSDPVAQHRP